MPPYVQFSPDFAACMERFLAAETLVVELLLVAALVAIFVRRLRVPYTVALVVAGLLLTYRQTEPIELTPELILAVLVPPLVFEAAFQIQLRQLWDNLLLILALAVPGVLLTTVVVGLIVAVGLALPLTTGLVFGALISATDPVSVVALFRRLTVPGRLAVIVEGESLFNDGTAVVLFQLVLAAALPEVAGVDPPSVAMATLDFISVSVGGTAIGLGLGWLTAQLIAWLDDYLIETTLTTVLAFGAFVMAEQLHVSGVLAVVGAGLVNGNIGPRGMSPTTRVVLFNFWEFVAFAVNSLVFLLIGSQVKLPQLMAALGPVTVAVLAVLASRAMVVYGLTWIVHRRRGSVPWAYRHVLFWGGLRGAISLALVLSLPATFPERDMLRVMTLGVVLFLLLIQGTTMSPLIRRLRLPHPDDGAREYERRQGRLMAAQAARQRLRQMSDAGLISAAIWEQLAPELDDEVRCRLDAHRELLRELPALEAGVLADARQEGLRAQRAALMNLRNEAQISEEVFDELVDEVDRQLEAAVTKPPTQPDGPRST
jgi:CPA1 family monovalent cation:H+ antiporter